MVILTGFQLRAARKVLNLTLDQLCSNVCITKSALMKLEKTDNLEEIICSTKDAQNLYNYFLENKLLFPNKHTIKLNEQIEPKDAYNNLTRFQFVAARTANKSSYISLSNIINIGSATLQAYEAKNNIEYLKSYKNIISDLILYFNENGISFSTNLSVSITK
jgi:hypothetical protein